MNYKPYKPLPPFKGMVLQNFPFIEEDFDAITNYQLLCKVEEYLKNVVANVVTVEENVTNLYNSFVELKNYVDNYFANLDVQEEINNKLDEMVEDGTLERILFNYLNIEKIYNTFEDLKLDKENLYNNMKVKTLGFYEVNDNGGATIKITNEEDENNYQLSLENGLYAQPIFYDKINLKCFGLKGDGITDNTLLLNTLFDFYNNKTLYIPNGVYIINSTLYPGNYCNIELENECEIKANSYMDYLIIYNKDALSYENKTHDKYFKGGILNGNNLINNSLFTIKSYMHFTLENIVFKNFPHYGLKTKFENTSGNELICNNLYFWNETQQENSLAIYNIARDGIFSNIIIRDTHYGILCYDGLYSKVHGWIGFKELIPNSYFIKSLDKATIVNECYADTYNYSFISSFLTMNISNSLILFNKDIYDEDLQLSNKPVIFKSEIDTYNLDSYGSFNAKNNTINNTNFPIILTNRTNNLNNFNNIIDDTNNCDFSNYQDSEYNFFHQIISGDVNNLNRPGIWYVNNSSNIPSDAYEYGIIYVIGTPSFDRAYMYNTNIAHLQQIYIPIGSSPQGIYVRNKASGEWQNWKKCTLN